MQKKTVEIKTKKEIFVACDGTEFSTKYECEEYENRVYFNKLCELPMRVPELDDICPIQYDDYPSSETEFRWFDLKTKRDVRSLNAHLPEGVQFDEPGVVCVEKSSSGEWYIYTYEDCVDYARKFFTEFGFELKLKKKEEE